MEMLALNTQELARFSVMERLQAGAMTQIQAADELGLCVRQVKRLLRRFRVGGAAAIASQRRGRRPNNALSEQLTTAILELCRGPYRRCGPTFIAEKLLERDGITLSRESVRLLLLANGLWQAKRRRRSVHPLRERRPCFGELVQSDGSPHAWFEERGPICTLLLTIDDATSRIGSGYFAPSETTDAYFELFEQHFTAHGRPIAFYVDKVGVFRVNQGQVFGQAQTQMGRALEELDIELICANSPQAKGRVERANRTLQDRLVKELRLRSISSIEAANAYLPHFIAEHNLRFARPPADEQNAHRTMSGIDLVPIFCHKFERKLSTNLMLQFENTLYSLIDPYSRTRLCAGVRVEICLQRDAQLIFRHAGRVLEYQVVGRQERKAAIVNAKDLNAHIDRRLPNPKKAHTPAANHPWKSHF